MTRRGLLIAFLVIAAGVVAANSHVVSLGLFSDDFQWLIGAQQFEAKSLLPFGAPNPFMRPVSNLYFLSAFDVCGYSSSCLHGAALVLHGATGLLVALLVSSLSRNVVIGIVAGALFAVQPGPTEALTWLSAACEVFGTFLYVLTFWLFRRAFEAGSDRRGVSYMLAVVFCYACMLAHEAGITLVPMLFLAAWMFPAREKRAVGVATSIGWLMPFVVVFLIYAVMLVLSATRSNNITGGHYALGLHMGRNIFGGLVSLAVASRTFFGFTAVAMFYVWALFVAPRRIRFWAIWTIATLLPFAGFRDNLPSRYFYMAAVGFAAMVAETMWWLREIAPRRRAVDVAIGIVTLFIVGRFALFERRNVHIWDNADTAYRDYAATVRRLYPSVAPGSTIVVPRPPEKEIGLIYVEPFLQWEYRDPALKVTLYAER